MSGETALIDTSVLVYAYDTSEKEKHNVCKELLISCWKGEVAFAVSIQNLSEFFVVATSKVEKHISIEDAKRSIERIVAFTSWIKIMPRTSTVMEAIKICREYELHYWDALLAATMRENNIFKIYTENETDFKKIPWLEVINPVKKAS